MLIHNLSVYYPYFIHSYPHFGDNLCQRRFTGFTGPSILHFFVEGLWKAILQDIVGMSFFLIYIVVIFFHKEQIVEM